jgi:hypothetical protein
MESLSHMTYRLLDNQIILGKIMLADEFRSSQQNGGVERHEQIAATSNILTETVISLLEERLIVDLTRRKIGDIVVRKEIETHLLQVQVPVRREKLIVEQVSPEYKRIAEIDLGQEQVDTGAIANDIEHKFALKDDRDKSISVELVGSEPSTIHGRSYSPKAASELLNELANMPDREWENIKIEIVLKNSNDHDNYQAVLDRYSQV